MSVRSVGNQRLETAPGLGLEGASQASASFWIRVNPGTSAPVGGVEVFGDSGGRFSATLSGAGSLRLRWSSRDGQDAEASSCTVALTGGVGHHLAATWRAGLQQYYLDGAQVLADSRGGVLGLPGVAAATPYRLGSDQPGVDVTLDRPTLWSGYALTPSDVVNLRAGTAQPGSIAPGSIALAWSLAGVDGAPATPGDAGLADSSPNGLNLSTVVGSPPTYQAGDLSYAPRPAVRATVAPSGEAILLIADDGTGTPAGITSLPTPGQVQVITIVGTPAIAPPAPALSAPVAGGKGAGSSQNLGFQFSVDSPQYATSLGLFQGADCVSTAGCPVYLADITAGVGSPTILAQAVAGTPPAGNAFNYAPIAPVALSVGKIYAAYATFPDSTATLGQYNIGTTTTSPDITIVGVNSAYGPIGDAVPTHGISNLMTTSFLYRSTPAPQAAFTLSLGGEVTDPIPVATSGQAVVAAGGPAAIQAALSALPGVGAAGVAVADETATGGSGVYPVLFAGTADRPPLVAADPAVTITRAASAAFQATLHLNGTPIPLDSWAWGAWDNGQSPPTLKDPSALPAYALAVLPQSAPEVQTFAWGELPSSGNPDRSFACPGSYSGAVPFSDTPGVAMCFDVEGLPPGTYQPAITWPTAIVDPYGSFVPSPTATVLVQDGTGLALSGMAGATTLATLSVDESRAPASYTDAAGRPWHALGSFTFSAPVNTLRVAVTTAGLGSASPAPVAIVDAMQLTRTSPDTSVRVGPGDVATLDIPAGLIGTTAGPIPATSGLAVAPPSPTAILPPFVASPKTLRVGYNVEMTSYYSNFTTHSNLARLLPASWAVVDADGYPTRISASRDGNNALELPATVRLPVLTPSPNLGGGANLGDPRQGTAAINPGLFVMTWDGDQGLVLLPGAFGCTVAEVSNNLAGKTSPLGNRRVYRITTDPTVCAGPSLAIQARSSTVDPANPSGDLCVFHLANLTIDPPDPSDPTGETTWADPPKFHPWFLDKVRGVQCLRFLDPINVNFNGCGDFAHYKPATHLNRNTAQGSGPVAIAQIRAATPAEATFPTMPHNLNLHVTTATPHGFFDGCPVSFSGTGLARFAGGSVDLTSNLNTTFAHPLDATSFLLLTSDYSAIYNQAMTNVLTGGTVSAPNLGTGWPLEDMTDLVKAAGATELWLNLAVTLDPTPGGAVDQVAAFLLANLPAGTKLHLEFGNECWNYFFATNQWCAIQDAAITGTFDYSYAKAYARGMKASQDRFAAVFAAAGRGADLVRVVGGQAGVSDRAVTILQELASIGGSADEACVATYYNIGPCQGAPSRSQLPTFDRMTPGQLLDYIEANAVHGLYAQTYVTDLRDAMASAGFAAVGVVAYEGSPGYLVPLDPPEAYSPPGITPSFYLRQNAVKRHPRIYGITLQYLQGYQDAGLALWNYFNLGGGTYYFCWEAYESGDQRKGTGDPTLDAVNVATPQDKNRALAEAAGAWHAWAGLVAPAAATTKGRLIPGRNGRVGAKGLPRGAFRLVGLR